MSNICIVVFVGVPGAGKTHFYKYFSEKMHLENTKISYISYDEEEKCMETAPYKNFRGKVYEKVDSLINKIVESDSKDNELIIIDDNMFYRSMRRSYYNLARKYTAGFCEIFISCTLDVAIDRNYLRTTNRVPTKVIIEMFSKLEPPSRDNSWEENSCIIDSTDNYTEDDVKVVSDLIQEAMKSPITAEEHCPSLVQQQNSFHNFDLLLRKLVSRKIKDAILSNESKFTIETLAQELLLKKKSVLEGIKNNEIFLPEYADNDEDLENLVCSLLLNMKIETSLLSENINNESETEDEIPNKKLKYSSDFDSNPSN